MELFDENIGQIQLKEPIYDSSQELDDAYSPRMTNYETIPASLGSSTILHLKYDLDPLHRFSILQEKLTK